MTNPLSAKLPSEETLTVEFKSDRDKLPDRELIEAVVGMANAEGGDIYLGVEDDGQPTGLHADHRPLTGLPGLVANRTAPRITVQVEELNVGGHFIGHITVPKASQIVATSDGTMKRRRLDAKGRPECVPLLPHEIPTRLSDLRALDASSEPVPDATLADLDPVERARVRQFVERFRGDASLLHLPDDELDGALGFVARNGSDKRPTLTGLLLIGKEAALRSLVRPHELAFQVLEGEQVRLNEFSREPLLRLFERIENLFKPLNQEDELQDGLFRVSVPRVDHLAFREALANALTHRDYTRLGAIHIRLESDTLSISNPGGFVEGVSQTNLLTTEPRPRNPALADAFKRLGLVERTGRGVDLIYRGLLRFGRPRPDYSRSNATNVVLRIPAADADLGFARLVLGEERKRGTVLPIDSLIALSVLREQRRVTSDELGSVIQKNRDAAKTTLEALVESGLVEPHGATRARAYTLAARVYTELDQQLEYTRQAGFSDIQQEQMVLSHVAAHGPIARETVMGLCRLSGDQATRLLKRLAEKGALVQEGKLRWTRYRLPEGQS